MKALPTTYPLLLGTVLLFGSAPSFADDAETEAEVLATLEAFANHLNAADWEAALGLYADDSRFYWIEAGRLAYPSRDALAQAFLGLGAAVESLVMELIEPRVLLLGDGYAYASAGSRQQMTFAGGESLELSGVISVLLVRTPEGWRFLTGHTSMEAPSGER